MPLIEKELSYAIVGAFFEVYNELGFGFAESVYSNALAVALRERGLTAEREHAVDVFFKGVQVGHHRLDLLVEGRVVVEVKTGERLSDGAKKQTLNYLAATQLQLALVLHFGLKAQSHRVLHPALIRRSWTDS